MTSSEVVPVATEHWSLQKGKESVKVVLPPSEWSPNSMVRRLRKGTILASFAAMFCVFSVVLDILSGKYTGLMISNAFLILVNLFNLRNFHNKRKQELDKSRTNSYDDPVAVAVLRRLPDDMVTDPRELLVAADWFTAEEKYNGDTIKGSPTTPAATVVQLLEDDEFADGVMEILWALASTNNPEAIHHAREGIHSMAEALKVKQEQQAAEEAKLKKLAALDTVAEVAAIAGANTAELVELARRGEYAPWHAPELDDPFGEGANFDLHSVEEVEDEQPNFDFGIDDDDYYFSACSELRWDHDRQLSSISQRIVLPPNKKEPSLPKRLNKLVRKLDGLVPVHDDDKFTLLEALLLMLTEDVDAHHKVTLDELLVVADDPHFRHLMVGTVSKLMHEGTKDSLLQACGDNLRMYHSLQGKLAKQRAVKALVDCPSTLPIKQFGVDKGDSLPVERPKVTAQGDDEEFFFDDWSF